MSHPYLATSHLLSGLADPGSEFMFREEGEGGRMIAKIIKHSRLFLLFDYLRNIEGMGRKKVLKPSNLHRPTGQPTHDKIRFKTN